MPRVVLIGASGKTGVAIARALTERDAEVVPIGRATWGRFPGELVGCDAVSIVAPNLYADEPAFVGEVLAAARAAGTPHVVHHSVTAPYAPAMPHHLGKARAEDVVRRSGLPWTILQPCAYVQNFVPALRSGATALEVPYDVRRPFGLVDLPTWPRRRPGSCSTTPTPGRRTSSAAPPRCRWRTWPQPRLA